MVKKSSYNFILYSILLKKSLENKNVHSSSHLYKKKNYKNKMRNISSLSYLYYHSFNQKFRDNLYFTNKRIKKIWISKFKKLSYGEYVLNCSKQYLVDNGCANIFSSFTSNKRNFVSSSPNKDKIIEFETIGKSHNITFQL